MVSFAQVACSIAAVVGLGFTMPVAAAEPEACPGLIASRDALFARVALRQDEVGLTFIGHATFLLETLQGVRVATDYNDSTRPPVTPDVATMKRRMPPTSAITRIQGSNMCSEAGTLPEVLPTMT